MAGFLLSMGSVPPPELVGSLPKGLPKDPSPSQVQYAEDVYERVRSACTLPRPGTGDVEDFWEQASRIEAALATGHQVWLMTGSSTVRLDGEGQMDNDTALGLLDLHLGHPDRLIVYGPIPQYHSMWQREETRAPDHYGDWPVFWEWAQRPTSMVGLDVSNHDAAETMARWVEKRIVEEGEEVILKARQAKHGLWAAPASSSVEQNRESLLHAMGWAFVRLESMESSLLLQKRIVMTHEYRIFMVDGRAVTGAGCLEETTPLWNTGQAFSPLTREARPWTFTRHGDEEDWDAEPRPAPAPPESRPDLVELYLEAARHIGAGLPPQAKTSVIDVAWDPTHSRVAMIECNGMSNAGLYATQPRLVAQAMAKYNL